MTNPGETLREAIITQDAEAAAIAAYELLKADPSARALRHELWRLPYRHWRPARLWMERVRDSHPNHVIREMFAALRQQFEHVRDADFFERRYVFGMLF